MSVKLICFLCNVEGTENRPVELFNNDDFKKCQDILASKKVSNQKYNDVQLPDDKTDSIGYHLNCLKQFSTMELYCFVCKKKPRGQTIVKFDQKKFLTCKDILAIKKEKNLVYGNLLLPDVLTDSEGYHSGCYRKFTALAKKYKPIEAENKK